MSRILLPFWFIIRVMKKLGVMILLKQQNELLFLVRKKENETFHQQGVYIPIGGKVENGESLEESAKRETKEESGVVIKNLTLRGVLYTRDISDNGFDDWVNYLFISEDFNGKPLAGNEGSFAWVNINGIQEINMYEGMKVFLVEVLQSRFLVMESEHEKYKLLSHKTLFRT